VKRILIAEDATRIASFISKGLTAMGYSASHVADGAEVIPTLNKGKFDLLVLDIGLPNKDGLAILEELRGTGNEIPVIVLTARDSIDATLASFQRGADDFMPKPFSFEELVARIERRIRASPSNSSKVSDSSLSVGPVTLDLLSRQVVSGGKEFELTAREFTILELLMRNAGQIISREQLLSRVWGIDHDPGSNVVDVYVRYLRQKLGSNAIETVRGLGYRFQAK
jgi:DNA-binding response OmpR family regulator